MKKCQNNQLISIKETKEDREASSNIKIYMGKIKKKGINNKKNQILKIQCMEIFKINMKGMKQLLKSYNKEK